MIIIEFYQYWMTPRKTWRSRLVPLLTVLFCGLLESCDHRISKEPIPQLETFSESLVESFLISDKSLTSFELNELIQYLKLHEQARWKNINEKEIDACLATFENNAELYELVSDYYLTKGNIEEALLYTTKAEGRGANSAEFFKKKANVYMALGDYGLAIDYLNKAVHVNRNDPDIYLLKGEVYIKLEDSISALKYKEQAFVHDSSRHDIAFDLAHIYASTNRNDEANLLADYLVKQSYRQEELNFLKVKILRKEDRQSEANQKLALMLGEGEINAGEQLVVYFMQKNMYDSAIYYSTDILHRDSLNLSALGAKALSFDHKGYFTSALMYYNQMLAIDSLNKEAIEGVRKVNGKIAYLRKLREQREAIPTFDFATDKKETN